MSSLWNDSSIETVARSEPRNIYISFYEALHPDAQLSLGRGKGAPTDPLRRVAFVKIIGKRNNTAVEKNARMINEVIYMFLGWGKNVFRDRYTCVGCNECELNDRVVGLLCWGLIAVFRFGVVFKSNWMLDVIFLSWYRLDVSCIMYDLVLEAWILTKWSVNQLRWFDVNLKRVW